jgi:hypothetical protein
MRGGRVHRHRPVSISQSLERQVLALLAIRPRLPFSVLVELLPNRLARDLFVALRHLREQGRVAVVPSGRDCDIVRVETEKTKGHGLDPCRCGRV